MAELGRDKFEIVVPSISMRTEPPVSIVDANASQSGAYTAAQIYLYYLYSPEAQNLAARFHYRPADPEIAKLHEKEFPDVNMISVDDPLFGGWQKTQTEHFKDGGIFDAIYVPKSE